MARTHFLLEEKYQPVEFRVALLAFVLLLRLPHTFAAVSEWQPFLSCTSAKSLLQTSGLCIAGFAVDQSSKVVPSHVHSPDHVGGSFITVTFRLSCNCFIREL